MKPVVAVPYFPGSNGDYDVINRLKEFNMTPFPLYFHIGDDARLERNARELEQCDGAVLPGGFPYEDRLGFGIVPSRVKPFADAMKSLAGKGKPVLAFCSGNQIAHAMGLVVGGVRLLPNICDTKGALVYNGFIDGKVHTRLCCPPSRTAFTRCYSPGEVIPNIIDHGGGRFWADDTALDVIFSNGLVVTKYCTADGAVVDEFPANPNGSMLNIESVTSPRGNVKIGMCHDERKLNALEQGRANLVFASMREYIEDGCPDLSGESEQQYPEYLFRAMNFKNFGYLEAPLDPERTLDIYIEMLTDDNERTTAELFLGFEVERRRLLQVELNGYPTEYISKVVLERIAQMDFLDGVMLKKDLPTLVSPGLPILRYEVVDRSNGRVVRDFVEKDELVPGFPVSHMQSSVPDPQGYAVLQALRRQRMLEFGVKNVRTGKVWFFRNCEERRRALDELLE